MRRRYVKVLLGVFFIVLVNLVLAKVNLPFARGTAFMVLLNLNLILIVVLLYLIGKNVLRLFSEKEGRIRTKLLISFLVISVVPSVTVFFISAVFLTKSIDYWFPLEGERTLRGALAVAQSYHDFVLRLVEHRSEKLKKFIKERGLTGITREEIKNWRKREGLDAVFIFNKKRVLFTSSVREELKNKVLLPQELSEGVKMVLGKGMEWVWGIRELGKGLYLLVGVYIPQNLSKWIEDISESYVSYSQLKEIRKPLKSMYILVLLIMTLLTVLAAVWLSYRISRSMADPIERLTLLAERVGKGDLEVREDDLPRGGEVGKLFETFLWMVGEIKRSREKIEQDRNFIESILQNTPAGIFAVDTDLRLMVANRYLEELLGFSLEGYVGKNLLDVLPENYRETCVMLLEKVKRAGKPVKERLDVKVSGRTLNLVLTLTPLKRGEDIWAVVGFVEDLTEMVKMQRIIAWRDAARKIAHEIKNPLTPIKISAERIRRKFLDRLGKDGEALDKATRTIIEEVEKISKLVREFSEMSRFPTVKLQKGDLKETVESVVKDFSQLYPEVRFIFKGETILLPHDVEQMKRVVFNLLKNAVEAMEGRDHKEVEVVLKREDKKAVLEVKDRGCGIKEEVKDRIFEPYFSTKDKGRGLGLTVVSTIVAEHKGRVYVKESSQEGTTIAVEFPLS